MDLPVMPPVAPMLAKPVPDLPDGSWSFEPKWDGFRTVVFRDGNEVELGSRRERPLTRYFPEVTEAVRANLPARCVVDAELIVPDTSGRRLDFDALLLRIHPAASRVRLLATQTPARLICFDLLALDQVDHMAEPFARRRAALEQALAGVEAPVHLTRPPPTGPWPPSGWAGSRAPGWTVWSPRPWTAPMSRTAGCGARSSTPGPPTVWSPATGCTSAAPT